MVRIDRVRWTARRPAAVFSAILLSVASISVYQVQSGSWLWAWREQPLAEIRPEIGLAYVASTGRPELSSHEHASAAVIVEDGRLLGPANAQHAEIRTLGGGRFSFWHDYVYVSSSDGSDPRINGRHYAYRVPPIGPAPARALYALTAAADATAVFMLLTLAAAPLAATARQARARLTATGGRVRSALDGMEASVGAMPAPLSALRRAARPGAGFAGVDGGAHYPHDVPRVAEPSAGQLERYARGLLPSRDAWAAVLDYARQASGRALAVAALAGLTAAFFAAVAIDPVPVLTWTSGRLGGTVAVALLIAAGYLAGVGVSPPSAELTDPSAGTAAQPTGWARLLLLPQIVALFALSVLAWLRPGIADLARLPSAARVALLCVIGGFLLPFAVPARIRARVLEWRHGGPPSAGWMLTAGAVLVALPILALPVARYWDSSGFMDSHSYDTYAINIANGKVPAGNSQYMPAYQYGMALVYYVFGHFFFVQQIVNVALAAVGITCLCWAGWILFRSAAAVAVIGLLAGLSQPFRYAIHFTQIESWFLPVTCVLLLAWAWYWRAGNWRAALALALAVSVGMNMRNQGAPFFALVCLTPLLMAGLAWRRRIAHVVVVGTIVAASLLPWTIRNYTVDGRFTPSGSRSTLYIGTLNDRRIGLYGIRYWEGWTEVAAEFTERYPDLAERERALMRSMWNNLAADPAWLVRAMYWRTASFYGLLPSGYLAIDRIAPTDWAVEWPTYLYWRSSALVILPLSLLGLIVRPGRTTLFLTAAIAANLSINVVSATSEDRLSYPVLLLHILLAGAIFGPRAGTRVPPPAAGLRTRRLVLPAAAGVLVFLVGSRLLVGASNTYRPLIEPAVTIAPSLDVDQALPVLDAATIGPAPGAAVDGAGRLETGQRVRIRGMLTNYMYPPKFTGAVGWVPAFATDADGPMFYYFMVLASAGTQGGSSRVGVTLQGASLSEALREGDAVDMEAEVLQDDRHGPSGLWLRALRLKKLPIDRAQLPPFP